MNKKQNNSFIKNTISSLHEVEHFLNNYNTFSDAISLLKILQHRKNKNYKNTH